MPRLPRRLIALTIAWVFTACGSEQNVVDGVGAAGGVSNADAVLPEGAGGQGGSGAKLHGDGSCQTVGVCGLLDCDTGALTGDHAEACSPLEFSTNPPDSGTHYSEWAQFGIYDQEFLRGFWLHTIEHSGVALLYNCARAEEAGLDCVKLVTELKDFYAEFPADPLCDGESVPHRLLIAPDSQLDAPFAAVAWGFYLKGVCFDPVAVRSFIDAHYGMNYENICASGLDPSSAGCE